MTTTQANSARTQLTKLAAQRGSDLQRLLTEYGNERFLCRLAQSRHANQFLLKGATLFAVWTGRPHRATKDIDLLGFGDPEASRLAAIFQEIASIEIPEDGVVFDPTSVTTSAIRKDSGYGGLRVTLRGQLARARLTVYVDVGFGDAVTPNPEQVVVPCLIPGLPVTGLRAYPMEVAIAEKFAAMVVLGPTNSRMKDLYDIWYLAQRFAFEGDRLASAIVGTFARRSITLPTAPPLALTREFATLPGKDLLWRGFLGRAGVDATPPLAEVVASNAAFLWPCCRDDGAAGASRWIAGGPWAMLKASSEDLAP